MFQGYIFDMDGVVVDNHQYHFRAWMDFARKYQFELNATIYRDKFNGKTNADLFRMIFGDIGPEQLKRYADEKEGFYRELYEKEMRPHHGLEAFMEKLSSSGRRIALGTSAPTENVDFVLDRLNLRHYFHAIVDGPQVKRGKPDPEVYTKCVSLLGLHPQDCIVFEDSRAGLESGKRAGCQVVGVATSHAKEELIDLTPTIITDFTEAGGL